MPEVASEEGEPAAWLDDWLCGTEEPEAGLEADELAGLEDAELAGLEDAAEEAVDAPATVVPGPME